jgi:hypothetical protein
MPSDQQGDHSECDLVGPDIHLAARVTPTAALTLACPALEKPNGTAIAAVIRR